jgi:hypothetical protein
MRKEQNGGLVFPGGWKMFDQMGTQLSEAKLEGEFLPIVINSLAVMEDRLGKLRLLLDARYINCFDKYKYSMRSCHISVFW